MLLRTFAAICTVLHLTTCSTSRQDWNYDITDRGLPLPIRLTEEIAEDTTVSIAQEPSWSSDTGEFSGSPIFPVAIRKVAPRFPSGPNVSAEDTGAVWVRSLVDSTGKVTKAAIIKSTNLKLNKLTLRAAIQWKFKWMIPRPQAMWITIPFRFSLDQR